MWARIAASGTSTRDTSWQRSYLEHERVPLTLFFEGLGEVRQDGVEVSVGHRSHVPPPAAPRSKRHDAYQPVHPQHMPCAVPEAPAWLGVGGRMAMVGALPLTSPLPCCLQDPDVPL